MPYKDPGKQRECRAKCVNKRRDRLIQAGLCDACGREPAAGDGQKCAACRDKRNKRTRVHFGHEGYRRCSRCGGTGHYAKTCNTAPV